MKTNILKLTVFLLFLAGSISSCEKEKRYEPTSLKGSQWKLVRASLPFNESELYDYSQYDIKYEFKTNNVLTVSGETNFTDSYLGHEIGEYFYSIIYDDQIIPGSSPVLKIDELYYLFRVTSTNLVIDSSPLDGVILEFDRIKYD